MKIVAFHLLNDYSGSPKVLKQLVKGWVEHRIKVTIVTNSNREGFLSNIQGADYKFHSYQWYANRFRRFTSLFLSQILLIIKFWNMLKKEDVIYVNTVLPFGAGILGKMKGCRVIYHVHETSLKPLWLKKFLFMIANFTAHDVVYVSRYLSQTEIIKKPIKHIHYNAIDNEFIRKVQFNGQDKAVRKNVLMVASLKAYKGIYEFANLAGSCPNYVFILVVNACDEDVKFFFKDRTLPSNLTIFTTQKNMHPFYKWADVVLNLSRPDGWIETFGLTILEAMAYGLPSIVPPVGGITELVDDGINGFHVDSRNSALLQIKLKTILESGDVYMQMKHQASLKIKYFNEDEFHSRSLLLLQTNSYKERIVYKEPSEME
jgi:glycosyltransferase involved in cell wall biosynthesis